MRRPCVCHAKNHREDNLTRISGGDLDAANGDPQPQPTGTAAWFCEKGLRERESRRRELERGRRAYSKRGKAA